jgi:phytoene dehydrogenase-like protein
MSNRLSYDAVVVGSGPNGLAAAVRLAAEGLSVLVLEANPRWGGGTCSAELTLPGFVHDLCSAVHPMAAGSPFLRTLPLERYGLHWVHPPVPLAHPLDDGSAAVLRRSIPETAAALGVDQLAYSRLMSPLFQRWQELSEEVLQPLLHLPTRPWLLARFGMNALRSATGLAQGVFTGEPARALFAGLCGHSFLRLEAPGSAAVGLVLGMMGHAVGWPIPRGGAQQIANALAASLREFGGELVTNCRVNSLDQLPLARAILLDLTPRQIVRLVGERLPVSYRERLERFRYGPGVFKVDYALSAPIPWKARGCEVAGTVHLGGTLSEIAAAESEVCVGRHPEKPFVLLSQPSLFDPSRAPVGRHTAWAYCHVPNGSTEDMLERIECQIDRFAPGFRDVVLARHTSTCVDLERANANLVGGDINGGAADLRQLLARPRLSVTPYRTPVPGLYICSASTPPGGGVHGMCGFHAAEAALHEIF